jgi:hypothetical protein
MELLPGSDGHYVVGGGLVEEARIGNVDRLAGIIGAEVHAIIPSLAAVTAFVRRKARGSHEGADIAVDHVLRVGAHRELPLIDFRPGVEDRRRMGGIRSRQ